MATSKVDPHGRESFPAGTASLTQFTFVALNASGQIVLPAANGLAVGILDDAPSNSGATLGANGMYSGGYTVGDYYGVVFRGLQKVYAAAALAPMTLVACNASGQAVAAAGTGTFILGMTLAGCNIGDLVPVSIASPGLHY